MTTQTSPITAEQLAAFGRDNRCELINGVLRQMTPAGFSHGYITGNVMGPLQQYVKLKKLGRVCAAETGFILSHDPDTVRAPDVAFVRSDRVGPSPRGYYPGPPDLAVEVVSPDDRVQEVEDKATAWLEAGTGVVWVVWPNTRTVSVHRPGSGPPTTLSNGDSLSGDQIVPGFEIPVADIFD